MPFPLTLTVEVKIGLPEQVALAKKTVKVIVPRGVPKPPDKLAVSVADVADVVRMIVDGET